MTRRAPEAALHIEVANYLRHACGPGVFATTFPAGGGGAARGGKLKGMGLRAGVPDWLIVHDGRALLVELKTKTGRVSEVQASAHHDLVMAGAQVAICRSVDDVEAALRAWGVPLRAVLYRRAAA